MRKLWAKLRKLRASSWQSPNSESWYTRIQTCRKLSLVVLIRDFKELISAILSRFCFLFLLLVCVMEKASFFLTFVFHNKLWSTIYLAIYIFCKNYIKFLYWQLLEAVWNSDYSLLWCDPVESARYFPTFPRYHITSSTFSLPYGWRQEAPPEHCYLSTRLYVITWQKIVTSIFSATRISNIIKYWTQFRYKSTTTYLTLYFLANTHCCMVKCAIISFLSTFRFS
jgi:hypothetical protein